MDLLIKRAHIVDVTQDFIGDLYIKDGIIEELGSNLEKDCETIDAAGLTLLPAFTDLHSHFRDPGLTHKEDILSGSRAAVKGGYTTVNLMANTKPICDNMDIVDYVMQKSRQIGVVDIHQTVSITKGLQGTDISHLDTIRPSVTLISDDGKGVQNSKVMLEAMLKAKKKKLRIITHAESEELIEIDSRLAENTMTWRDITLAKFTGCPLHIAHVSTKEAIEYIIQAKQEGIDLTCEVTPHHIALTDEISYRVNPPLRQQKDVESLTAAIKEGWVDAIGTDHAPHTIEDKLQGAPGISGIETSFSVCYTKLVKEGHITLQKLTALMCKNPATIMGFHKGELQPSFAGDVVLVDLTKRITVEADQLFSKGKNTPFNGMDFFGKVLMTIKGGKIVYDKEDIYYDNKSAI